MTKQQIGRLAMRHEGDWWRAYYARPETMKGALLLGTIHMSLAVIPEVKESFMATMKTALSAIIEEKIGEELLWPEPPRPAPESERSGHG